MDRLPAFLVLDMHMALVAYSLSAYNWSPTRQRLHGFVGSKRACRRPLPPPDFNAIFSLSILTAEVKHCTVRIFTLKLQPLLLLPVLMFLHRMSCEFHEKQFDSTPAKFPLFWSKQDCSYSQPIVVLVHYHTRTSLLKRMNG
jgi:hypothetical protein